MLFNLDQSKNLLLGKKLIIEPKVVFNCYFLMTDKKLKESS